MYKINPMQNRILFVLLSLIWLTISCEQEKNADKNPAKEKKINTLLEKMTLEEKIGQMTQICISTITSDGTKDMNLDTALLTEALKTYHVGSFLSASGPSKKWARFVGQLQETARENTRLQIPLILAIDHIHGTNYVDDGTFFPHNLLLSCSFDTALVAGTARVTALETGVLALSWNFAPVLDIGKNPYWPRLYETYGESPLVCSKMGKAFVSAYQEKNQSNGYPLAACGKHFIGYSDPNSGWDRTPADIPDQTMHEHFVPSFQAAIDAGVQTMMINSGEVNGVPVHASKEIVTGLLREKMGFTGVIVTDIKDILKLVEMHSAAKNQKEATMMAINAGIDMSMSCDAYTFCKHMKELVKEGKISEKRIDESVARILALKYELGLFDNPFPDKENLGLIGQKEHAEMAEKAAAESMVLLKNDGLLPLSKETDILVAGIGARSKKMLNGAWTLEWLGAEEEAQPEHMNTFFGALEKEFSSAKVNWLPQVNNMSASYKKTFKQQAAMADVLVLAIGEKPYSEFKGNINDLSLAKNQQELVRLAYATGKPTVLILIEGRPRLITSLAKKASAILFAGYPGIRGGEAIAAILSGRANPSGKLSFTYPRDVSHNTPFYHKPSDEYTPLYPFGHGLSYTGFDYSNLVLGDSVIPHGKNLPVSVDITNTGKREGKESVLWFMRDEVGIITRPVKQLLHFEKIQLGPGETKTVQLEVVPEKHLCYPDQNGDQVLEKGYFTLYVGGLEGRFVYR